MRCADRQCQSEITLSSKLGKRQQYLAISCGSKLTWRSRGLQCVEQPVISKHPLWVLIRPREIAAAKVGSTSSTAPARCRSPMPARKGSSRGRRPRSVGGVLGQQDRADAASIAGRQPITVLLITVLLEPLEWARDQREGGSDQADRFPRRGAGEHSGGARSRGGQYAGEEPVVPGECRCRRHRARCARADHPDQPR